MAHWCIRVQSMLAELGLDAFASAEVAELADATDLKSVRPRGLCGFDPRPRQLPHPSEAVALVRRLTSLPAVSILGTPGLWVLGQGRLHARGHADRDALDAMRPRLENMTSLQRDL